jgi:hypothetical protein
MCNKGCQDIVTSWNLDDDSVRLITLSMKDAQKSSDESRAASSSFVLHLPKHPRINEGALGSCATTPSVMIGDQKANFPAIRLLLVMHPHPDQQ